MKSLLGSTAPLLPALRRELVAAAGRLGDQEPSAGRRQSPSGRAGRPLGAWLLVIVGVVVMIVGINGWATGGNGDGVRATHPDPGSPARSRPNRAASMQAVRTEFAVFRVPLENPTSRDGNLFDALAPETGDPAAARRLAVPGREVWVAPGSRGGVAQLCMRVRSALDAGEVFGSCVRLEYARDHGLFMGSRPAPRSPHAHGREVAGLVPDGVLSVTFTFGDAPESEVPVHDNAVNAEFDRGPTGVRFRDARGKVHTTRF